MSEPRAWLIGSGPGAPDLLTVRGARLIADADIVIWGANLVMEEAVTENARPDAELIPWPPAKMEDILAAYTRAADEGLKVARLVGGDPAVYVDMDEELRHAAEQGVGCEIVPGVGALSAVAAALGRELVTARTEQAMVIASPRADLESLLTPGVVAAIYMSGRESALAERLLGSGWSAETACALVASATWPDQAVVRCRLDELDGLMAEGRFGRRTMLIVGLR